MYPSLSYVTCTPFWIHCLRFFFFYPISRLRNYNEECSWSRHPSNSCRPSKSPWNRTGGPYPILGKSHKLTFLPQTYFEPFSILSLLKSSSYHYYVFQSVTWHQKKMNKTSLNSPKLLFNWNTWWEISCFHHALCAALSF